MILLVIDESFYLSIFEGSIGMDFENCFWSFEDTRSESLEKSEIKIGFCES